MKNDRAATSSDQCKTRPLYYNIIIYKMLLSHYNPRVTQARQRTTKVVKQFIIDKQFQL